MCTSKTKVTVGIESSTTTNTITTVARINGRPVLQPTCNRVPNLERKKSKSFKEGSSCGAIEASLSYSSSLITDSPGSIAAVRREQVALQQAQRKMKIAHYGRSKSAKYYNTNSYIVPLHPFISKKCSFRFIE